MIGKKKWRRNGLMKAKDAGHWEDDWNGGEQVPVCSANGG